MTRAGEAAAAPVAHSLIVRCADVTLALPLEPVVEVVRMVALAARVPRAPRYCLGAINYHGQLLPLLDLGARLALCPPRSVTALEGARIVLARGSDGITGYAVDEVTELSERAAEPVPGGGIALTGLGGLIRGVVRWRDGATAPLIGFGGLLPVVAGARLRQAVAALASREGGA